MKSKPFVIACIPAYNEEKTIAKVILQTRKYVDKIIVCDDGSQDITGEIAEALGAIVIRHKENMGKGMALKSLLLEAQKYDPDIVVTLDADGQHDPALIPKLIQPILDGEADMVIASRFIGKNRVEIPRYRKMGLKIIDIIQPYNNIKDTQSGYRAYGGKAIPILLKARTKGYGIEIEQIKLAIENSLKIIEIPAKIKYKKLPKTSKKNPLTHMAEIIITILRLTLEKRPLTYLGIPAGILYVISFYSGMQLINLYLKNRYFSIPYALIAIITFITALILTTTAIQLYIIIKLIRSKKV